MHKQKVSDNEEDRRKAMEESIHNFLLVSGVCLDDPHLLETPRRVASAYIDEFLSGYRVRPEDLFKNFDEPSEQTVIVQNIPFYSLCAHHLLPFFGKASIAYKPNGKIIGLSKIGRVVECFARRLQVQERMTTQIADVIYANLKPKGVIVLLAAEHMCMSMRGIRNLDTNTVSYAARGEFETDRSECDRILGQILRKN